MILVFFLVRRKVSTLIKEMIFKLYPKYVYFRTESTKCTETALLLKYYHQETTEYSMNTRHMEGSRV